MNKQTVSITGGLYVNIVVFSFQFSLHCFGTVGLATEQLAICKKLGVGMLVMTI